MIVGGSVLLALGAGAGVTGGMMAPALGGQGSFSEFLGGLGVSLIVTSVVCVGAGIPLVVVGAERVPMAPRATLGLGRVDVSLSF